MSRAHPRPRTSFVTSAASPKDFPPPSLPELAVVGRSNVGKSSLINALVGQDGLARTSRTPGRTQLINWFEVSAQPPFHLVDLPGFGYAKVPTGMKDSWKPLIEAYLSERKTLAGVLLLIDIRRGPEEEELDFVPWLAQRDVPIVVALTKSDKLVKSKRMVEITRARQALNLTRAPFAVSTLSSDGIDEVWRALIKILVPAK
ncbi:MAG: YihA family ribosome biogenesis GTP-binding protein [Myxococcales bacterium]|nr:YihA family ribosome biogenesis GTP-binding protein [Myxococcales bacterium]